VNAVVKDHTALGIAIDASRDELATRLSPAALVAPRGIARHVHGRQHGPIQRLVSPSDIGELIKPFVFLDYANVPPSNAMIGIHPHSGIATLTVVISGALAYEDTTGKSGNVAAGGLEWMKAGGGVWHDGHALGPTSLKAYQLWLALPPSEENAPAESQYVTPEQVQHEGPARVVLGQLRNAKSVIRAPRGINYLHVKLKDGEHWRYTPPTGHTVAWVSVYEGELRTPDIVHAQTLAVFEESESAIDFVANGDTAFVLGSAIKHPHDLVTGYYSVHTHADALDRGEGEIRRIGARLLASGRLQQPIRL
jgi:redox-sensitive bicupin YhaK (pirin superfamily)